MTAAAAQSPRQYFDSRFAALKDERTSWEAEWRDLCDFILQQRGRWVTTEANKGGRRNRKVYDGTAGYAARTLASGLMAGITSPARSWFRLGTTPTELADDAEVKIWLDAVENKISAVFAQSNLYNVLPNVYSELGVIGTACMLIYEDSEDVIRCQGLTVGEYWLATDDRGSVNAVYREFDWSVSQVVSRFCKEGGKVTEAGLAKLSQATRDLWAMGKLNAKITIRHAIEPNDEYRPGMLGLAGKKWRSFWWERGGAKEPAGTDFLAKEGFKEKPFVAPRWNVIGQDTYGRGPGTDTLGDVISLQAMTRKKAIAVDKMIDPPMNLPGTMKNGNGFGYGTDAGTLNFVDGMGQGITAQAAQSVSPNLSHFVADIQEIQNRIKVGLYETLFLMLVEMDRAQITATEIIERKAEKLIGLGPVIERLNDEMLDPIIDRVFQILLDGGLLPPPPQALAGTDLRVEFLSIFRQAQEQEDVTRIDAFVQRGGLLAQLTQSPDSLDWIDVDEGMKIIGHKTGVPAKVVRSQEAVDQIRQGRAQQQQQAQQMQMGAQAVEAAKGLSEIQVSPERTALAAILNQ